MPESEGIQDQLHKGSMCVVEDKHLTYILSSTNAADERRKTRSAIMTCIESYAKLELRKLHSNEHQIRNVDPIYQLIHVARQKLVQGNRDE